MVSGSLGLGEEKGRHQRVNIQSGSIGLEIRKGILTAHSCLFFSQPFRMPYLSPCFFRLAGGNKSQRVSTKYISRACHRSHDFALNFYCLISEFLCDSLVFKF